MQEHLIVLQKILEQFAQKTLRLTEVNYGRIYFISTNQIFLIMLFIQGMEPLLVVVEMLLQELDFNLILLGLKNRDTTDSHMLFDAVRGATNILSSDSNAAESNNTESLTTWGADGFTLGIKVLLIIMLKITYLGIGKQERQQELLEVQV